MGGFWPSARSALVKRAAVQNGTVWGWCGSETVASGNTNATAEQPWQLAQVLQCPFASDAWPCSASFEAIAACSMQSAWADSLALDWALVLVVVVVVVVVAICIAICIAMASPAQLRNGSRAIRMARTM